jgi:hypothetical protein
MLGHALERPYFDYSLRQWKVITQRKEKTTRYGLTVQLQKTIFHGFMIYFARLKKTPISLIYNFANRYYSTPFYDKKQLTI